MDKGNWIIIAVGIACITGLTIYANYLGICFQIIKLQERNNMYEQQQIYVDWSNQALNENIRNNERAQVEIILEAREHIQYMREQGII